MGNIGINGYDKACHQKELVQAEGQDVKNDVIERVEESCGIKTSDQ
jgi:hypothetical protein